MSTKGSTKLSQEDIKGPEPEFSYSQTKKGLAEFKVL